MDTNTTTPAPVLVIAGTRPEAIKLAPIIERLQWDDRPCHVLHTGQHPNDSEHQAAGHGLIAHTQVELDPAARAGGMTTMLAAVVHEVQQVASTLRPSAILVQGDTLSALAGALAGFLARTPVVHVEAGLRSDDLASPFPEEGFRRLITSIASMHCAPDELAAERLRAEGVPAARIVVTGNTALESLTATRVASDGAHVLVTLHRRELSDRAARTALREAARIAAEHGVPCRYVAHPAGRFDAVASATPGVTVLAPQPRMRFLELLASAHLVVTDSGGTQEECVALGTPVLVARAATERPIARASAAVLSDPARSTEFGLDLSRFAERARHYRGAAAARRSGGTEPSANVIGALTALGAFG